MKMSPACLSFELEKLAILPILRMPDYTALELGDSMDITNVILHQLRKYPLLKPHEEIQIAKVIQQWRDLQQMAAADLRVEASTLTDLQIADFAQQFSLNTKQMLLLKHQAEKGKELLYNCNRRLVVSIAKRYKRRYGTKHLALVDLIQAGEIGLLRAANSFDVTKGCKFSTHAFQWIRQSIGKTFMTEERTIRYPVYVEDLRAKAVRTAAKLAVHPKFAERTPTLNDVAKAAKLRPEKVSFAIAQPKVTASTNQIVGQEQRTELGELLADSAAERAAQSQENLDLLGDLMRKHLSAREQTVVQLCYGLNGNAPSKHEIAEQLNISYRVVLSILKKAAGKLSKAVTNENLQLADFLG